MQNVYLNIVFLLISSLGVDDAREDDARFGTRGRSLLQNMTNEEFISMSTSGCDPSQGTGACGPSFQGECMDDLPSNTALECSDYVRLDLCGQIDEDFCKVSCDRCPEVCEDVLVPLTKDCAKIIDGNKCDDPEIKGVYCQKSCGQCQSNKAISSPFPPRSYPNPPLPPPPTPPPTPPAPLPSTVSTETTIDDAMKSLQIMTTQILWYGQDYCSSESVTCDGNKITLINLYRAELKGTIPKEISVLTALTYLSFEVNSIEGTIPAEISVLTALTYLGLMSNSIEGTIPPQISSLVDLKELLLYSNAITGTLPPQLSTLEKLTIFTVTFNSITGTLPAEYSTMKLVERFDARSNSLQGTLPAEYSTMELLVSFSARLNSVQGTVPLFFTKISSLGLAGNPLLCVVDQEKYPGLSDVEVLPCN